MKILIIDDDPAIRLLATAALEQADGFQVTTARDGREGLGLARRARYDLILLDQLMPDMPGHTVLEHLRDDPATSEHPVAFFTAKTNDEDVASMRALGVVGVIGKPFEPGALAEQVRQVLAANGRLEPCAGERPVSLTDQLTEEFLSEGRREVETLLGELDAGAELDAKTASHVVHRWVGRGGTFGCPRISDMARLIEHDIDGFPESATTLREHLREIRTLFAEGPASRGSKEPAIAPRAVPTDSVVEQVREGLAGVRVALIGFEWTEVDRLTRILGMAGAFARSIPVEAAEPDAGRIAPFDLVFRNVEAETEGAEPTAAGRDDRTPVLRIGPPEGLSGGAQIDGPGDFVVWPAQPEELLLRAHRLVSARQRERVPDSSQNRSVIIADDDPTVTALLVHTLTSYGFECHPVESGTDALALASEHRPAAVLLDINMPGMNGFEVLSQLKSRSATRSIPVLMVTARSQEADVLRGFSLGAADYVAKPFNPIEVAARLKRVLNTDHRPVAA